VYDTAATPAEFTDWTVSFDNNSPNEKVTITIPAAYWAGKIKLTYDFTLKVISDCGTPYNEKWAFVNGGNTLTLKVRCKNSMSMKQMTGGIYGT